MSRSVIFTELKNAVEWARLPRTIEMEKVRVVNVGLYRLLEFSPTCRR